MSHYRKKPLVVEAYRFADDARPPDWLRNAFNDGSVVYSQSVTGLIIKMREGDVKVQLGDWIIKDLNGELYPCRDDIFQATYEPVEQAEADA